MKKVVYVIIGLVVVYLILCLIGPKDSSISRSIVINQKPDIVKAALLDFKFFNEKWSPWTEKDPNMKIEYSGEVGKVGCKYDWSGNDEVKSGSMEFVGVVGDTIKQKLIFKDWAMISNVYLITTPEGAGSKVTWSLSMPMGFIWRGMGIFMTGEKAMGPDFDKGIAKMKIAMESLVAPVANYDVRELNWEAKTFYGIRGKMEFMKMAAFFGESYGKIGEALGKAKATPIGAPKAIYFSFDEKTMVGDLAAVMEFANGTKISGLEKWETPAGKVLLIEYYGSYDKSGNAHYAMDAYMKEKGYTQGTVLEEYVTDPMSEKDTAKWLTNIFYIVK
ncbi:MAG: GyrI-like domain-containing protein [Bacteroidia bacterium]|nr:GyrI-like domain-containing protein [Bacteroidia bacterium]